MSVNLRQSVKTWLNDTRAANRDATFDQMVKEFGVEAVIDELAKRHWRLNVTFCEKFSGVHALAHRSRPTNKKLTVALYYHRITNGGAENVCVMLCNRFAEQKNERGEDKYNIVMVTDVAPQPDEYPLLPKVKRAFVPSSETAVKKHYLERYKAWRTIIEELDIDIVVHSQWLSDGAF